MPKINECEHEWAKNTLYAVASTDHPEMATRNPRQHVGHVPLEYCIHCGVLRLPEAYHGKGGNIAY